MCPASADSCDNPTATCQIDTVYRGCFMMAEENTLEGTQTKAFSRGCSGDQNNRKEVISFTVGKGKYVRLSTEICNTDNCNAAKLEVPKENTTKNGLQCPTCFSLNSDPCNSSVTPCMGDETYCIDFAGILQKATSASDISTFVAKGCATTYAKDITTGSPLVSALSAFVFTKATAKPAEKLTNSGSSPALGRFSFALYLPGLTGLLLVKLLS
ncbi:phospholipase A2 inhibitor and Ly6/PLAUR domain-containing protein-like [Mauremys reevesii]|uniref:phospholipase A2 inhibitor and Ly6/PLAUR domain-containing protein-like n=1 Tax=Mauremys reevesii TaxID=260615 RepID=UPI00193F53FE|nr:phospholipase A2 inhibitor and Ly6/PLAUR domain-containing protein-like [Mauremys reevesii]